MPVPNIILSTDSFNTWIDATNNLISHVVNTSSFILVQSTASPVASVGNVALNGVATLWTTKIVGNATGNLVFEANGTTVHVNTIMSVVGGATFSNTVSISGATTLLGTLAVNSAATITNATFSVVNSSATQFSTNTTTTNVGTSLTVVGAATFQHSATVTNASATIFVVNSSALTVNTTNFNVNSAMTLTKTLTTSGGLVTNSLVELAGPIHANPGFIHEVGLGGEGVISKMTLAANTGVLRINSITSVVKTLAGIEVVNTSAYRMLTILNAADNPLTFLHDNASATLATERVLCPSARDFVLAPGAGAALFYDANTSVQRWRVLSTSSQQAANSTVAGVVTTGTQSFGGAKTFEGSKVIISNNTGFVLPVGANKYAT